MTDNEIIKALECCTDIDIDSCEKCPIRIECYANDIDIKKEALDLIDRQRIEIERLIINMNAFGLGMKREKERADTAKAEAIKEFAKRLKERNIEHFPIVWERANRLVNNLVKEMVGEDNE